MERRDFLKFALGAVAGAAALATSAQAAPLMPQPPNENDRLPANPGTQPAVTSKEEADRLAPEEVRWHRGRHWHRRRRPWRRRHWRRW
ncbi:twin-arginine translocation signal domain-containing protein [Bradyrhizobium lablabi]|uniref:twin-arginine translocation signal domain-containing protein n=1 Tax=Bradyrhizobium lablabi TaxID=722472 RepID=UPI001BAAA437|nr:twin-arginine translocation signal domain-containing protein [Bradyrhizobium lablabi]MBR1126602.1 twin-arginine translocation signal domain-containing protein [Bradyrhizobium lablabi]